MRILTVARRWLVIRIALLKDLFRKPGPPRFDSVLEGSDVDLMLDLVGRIEDHKWHPRRILSLSEPEAHLCRLCRFDGIFGNGGLQYWFECDDSKLYGVHTASALRAIGLPDAAEALEQAYALFPSTVHHEDSDLLIEALSERASDLEPLEEQLWRVHEEITPRTAEFVRANRSAFEHLRTRRPWDDLMNEYGDA